LSDFAFSDLEKALAHFTLFLSPGDLQGLYSAFSSASGVFDFKAFARQLFPRGEESAESDKTNYTTMVFGPNQHYESYQQQLSKRLFSVLCMVERVRLREFARSRPQA
jgi:hypothetical protein